MKKKILLLIILLSTILGFSYCKVFAASSTAEAKGFYTNNMTYLDDAHYDNYTMRTSKYVYGYTSMWIAAYKNIVKETDNSNTCYYTFFIESSIESTGNSVSKRYFRNKDLNISVDSTNSKNAQLIAHYPAPSSSTTTISHGFSVGADSSGNVSASYSFEKSVSYDTVVLTNYYGTTDNIFKFMYHFSNYDDGSMVSPNVGLIVEKMAITYAFYNYTGNEKVSFAFYTDSTIFKDATFPLSNGELTGRILYQFENNSFGGPVVGLI